MKTLCFSVLMTFFVLEVNLLSSCSQQLPKDEILFTLPQWPCEKEDQYFPSLVAWEICLFNGSEKMKFTLDKNQEAFSILETGFSFERNGFFTVTARPITISPTQEETVFFKAAGSVYPHLAKNSKLNLTWQDGFTAFVASCILETNKNSLYTEEQRRNFCQHFNWKRFSDCLTEKGKDPFYNPWLCDIARIVSSICGKRFSSIYLNVKKGTSETPSPLGKGFSSYIPAKKQSE